MPRRASRRASSRFRALTATRRVDVARAHVAVALSNDRVHVVSHHLLELLDEDAPVAEQVLDRPRSSWWRDASKLRRISARISARDSGAWLAARSALRINENTWPNDERLQVHPADARVSVATRGA